MTKSEKLGLVILSVVLLFFAAITVGAVVLGVWGVSRDATAATVGRLVMTTGITAMAWCFGWQGVRQGKGNALRWAAVVFLALSVPFLSWVAVITGRPLPDPAEQAIWERDSWWMAPVTWGMAAGCLVAAVLLCLPPVGEALRFLKAKDVKAAA